MAITIGNNGTPSAAALPTAPQGVPQPAAGRVSSAVPEPVPQQQPTPKDLERVVDAMKQLIESKAPNSLSFAIDDSTGKTVIRISDAQTGEMIRQIPSEEMLEIARSLDKLQGLLLQQQA